MLLWVSAQAAAAVHHDLEVVVDVERSYLVVTDTITVESGADPLEFDLHPGLIPELLTPDATLEVFSSKSTSEPPALNITSDAAAPEPVRYLVRLPTGQNRFTLRYQGQIRHALQEGGEEYARQFRETAGTITPAGVFLSGRSHWYPQIRDDMMTFDLRLSLPTGWYGMSQGDRVTREGDAAAVREHWRCDPPQEEIYLIAGPFTEYTQAADGVEAMVLLREPDPALAQKYLDATGDYVRLYSELIGPYPFGKFALVENFWETGYGMPSFTLLGSKVIRFPFILHSSYPHEILHNWWGNGVYVDYGSGNWAEGLTSYLADHLIKEQRGKGVEYRRNTLQKYTDHVRTQQDFPLTAFRSRHSAVTQAVGYGKTLMLFHMLRGELGDETFIKGLRTLYRDNRFSVADYGAVEAAFSQVAGRPLGDFFAQWVTRSGAPQLRVSAAHARPSADGYVLSAVIEQVQDAGPYDLRVPIAVQLAGREQAWQTEIRLEAKREQIELALPARPLQLAVDPAFDVFRRLHPSETPPAVSQAMGAERVLVVLPAAAPAELARAYTDLARAWQAGQPGRIEVALDSDLESLPTDRSVWLFGWKNRFRPHMAKALADYAYEDQGTGVTIDGTALSEREHAIAVLGRQADRPDQAFGWLAAGQAAAIPGLGRKLPHYGKYSYLAFTGTAPDNVLKGQWPVVGSPLSVTVAQQDGKPVAPGVMQLAPRNPLVAPRAEFSVERMQADIARLADASLQGRGLGTAELDQAADYIAAQLRAAGLQPGASDGQSWYQAWEAAVPALGRTVSLKNVIGILPGSDPARAGESLVIGAHYDHLGRGDYAGQAADRGQVHPGADDNASGVAVLLELARTLAGKPQPRSIVFGAFTGEEAARLGSRHFVENAANYPTDKMIAMINLDTVGRLGARPLLALGSGTAEEWVHILRGAGYVTGVPVKAVADDIGSSDQTSFIEAGVPAVQLFAGAHEDFHGPGDTPERIDAAGLVKTAQVLKEMTVYLAGRPEALSSSLGSTQRILAEPSAQTRRRVSLGIVPDYSESGQGVRVDEVRAGTSAEAAGLRAGDIIIALNGTPLKNLRDYTA
ncbi:MAG: M20/M25/M40 family metallo-hydrolase, partial [Thiohalobacterales bacterium]|nr:M20/M25/M40 family metallo-hydrolase [Thiohalobacterales bacterium]